MNVGILLEGDIAEFSGVTAEMEEGELVLADGSIFPNTAIMACIMHKGENYVSELYYKENYYLFICFQ